ncbi:MAG TPA: hypothetical protein VME66_14220 [Candidatus Acidoferrales bacterium]|nr:hypothetical protein [Candidatus Acidoferrales bacterium]
MKPNVPRFWTPRTGGLLTLAGLAVVTVGATLLGESLIGRGGPSQTAAPGPKLTIAPIFQGLQGAHHGATATRSIARAAFAPRPHHHQHHGVAPAPVVVHVPAPPVTEAPVVVAAPVIVKAAPDVVAERPVPLPPKAPLFAPPLAVAVLHKHHHAKHALAVAETPPRVDPNAAWPTERPLPPRQLIPVTTMTAPPPVSIQLRPVETVTAAPPSSSPLVPVETVTAAPPRT